MELRVARKYRLGRKIGAGNNAYVYEGTNIWTGEEVALKLERVWDSSGHLENEYKVYRYLYLQGT
jgi:casein kinase I homolog HRR25